MKRIALICAVILTACSSKRVTSTNNTGAANSTANTAITINGKLYATIWQQSAAEYRALCLQAFNIAQLRLDQYKPETNKPKAIITDIDETVLDNSPYEAHQTLQNKDYEPSSWYEWTGQANADTVPGGASFLKYAASKGVEIFYITNRDERERSSTLKNLQHYRFPNADDAHFFPKTSSGSGKETRRQNIAATHEIIMLLGDNLADFSNLFDKKDLNERLQNTNASAKDFGNRFIVLPNPVYGDWEGALFKYNRALTNAQKDSVIKAEVKSY